MTGVLLAMPPADFVLHESLFQVAHFQMLTKSALPGARRADVTGFGVPEHHGDGSALPMLVQSGNLSLEIWSSGILMEPVPRDKRAAISAVWSNARSVGE